MINIKEEIACNIEKATGLKKEKIIEYIESPKETTKGDYAFPCFRLAKEMKKAPQIIAEEIAEKIKEKIEIDSKVIEKIEVVGAYINFYVNKQLLAKEVIEEIAKSEQYGQSSIGKGKNIIIEYSSPNIAKPFHIGHLRTTLIGNALYRTYKYLGYNTIGINHLGDYGTQFGKMIEAYKMWGHEYNLEEDPIDKMVDMYVRINALCKEDEEVLERCRENFRLLEEKDSYCLELWNKFKDLSMLEFQKIYEVLDIKFDSFKGEASYADQKEEIIKKLEEKGKITESEGAKIVDLEDVGISTPCLIQKANGSSIYATRDLAAIMYRAKTYDFDKCLYIVAYEQNLHFKQIFEVAKYLVDEKYQKGLKHVSYGMVSLPTGKMSTRLGNVLKIEDLLNETIEKAKEIIEEKNPQLEYKEEVAKKVGIGAIVFNTLSTANIKDQVFDWNTALNFQGETGPYIQYSYVRTNSVIEKVGYIPQAQDVEVEKLEDEYSFNLIKLIYNFQDILIQVTEKEEPSIISRYLIDVAKAFSSFYNANKIICEDKKTQDARVYLTYVTGIVLKQGAELLGIKMPNKM
ncbi:MAG: arginine--tRNA ligase [Clostridia bacterium]|nr:arginine--tRNA ligase [Clostridia bacterium]